MQQDLINLTRIVGLLGLACLCTQANAQHSRRTPIVEVIEQAQDAVVNISTTRIIQTRRLSLDYYLDDIFRTGPRRRAGVETHSVGSGAVIHPSGYIITNAHVIAQASDITVTFTNDVTLSAEIVAADPAFDLAVLKVDAKQPLKSLKLGSSEDILIGETVIAIGNPLGLGHTVTTGIVSALGRSLEFPNRSFDGLIQTDTAINPGNSGGPLLNINAELIGINTAIRGDAQNIGFAIPVARLWQELPRLLDIERHRRVRVGLSVDGLRATINQIIPDSPADQAGLKAGDRVIAFNQQPVDSGIDYYVQLQQHEPGDTVRIGIRRGTQQFDRSFKIEPIPLPDGAKLARERLGLNLVEITPQTRRRYDLPRYVSLITDSVEQNSPADRAGIRTGDVILRIERVPTATLIDLGLVLERVPARESILIEGVRLDPFFSWDVRIPTR
jgi:serine protease Do